MTLLTAYLVSGNPVTDGVWDESDLAGNPALLNEASVSTGYQDISSPENWDKWWSESRLKYKEMRNNLIAVYITPGTFWGTASTAAKQALLRHYVWPSGTSTPDLDALYTSSERSSFRRKTMRRLNNSGANSLIRRSTQTNSTFFDIGVNDAGTIAAFEIDTFTEIP